MSEFYTYSLKTIRTQLLSGAVKAEEVVQSCLARIKETEPKINALLALREEEALAEARLLDSTPPDPTKPLFGIPVTVKDLLATKGTATTAGSRILENFVPFYDACVVEKLKAAGAIVLAKNNMDEFAMGSSTENSAYGATHNPRDLTAIPGGSSGGSAASVAAEQCFASLGTDTGGSIRQPASHCGCVGLKPSYGRVSRYGVIAYGSSLDQVGPLTRTVEDCAIVFGVIAGHDPRDSTSDPRSAPDQQTLAEALKRHDLKGLRVGVPRDFMDAEGLDPEVSAACHKALEMAQQLGAEAVDVTLPRATRHAIASYYILAMAEASSNLARYDGVRFGLRSPKVENLEELYTQSRTLGFGAEVQRRILLGTYVLSAGYYDAYFRKAAQVRRLVRQDYLDALTTCDFMLAPVSPVPAWNIGSIIDDPLKMYLMDIFTVSLNLAGLPGLSIPVGTANTRPVGIQLIGRDFDESTILSVGHVLESAFGPMAYNRL